MAHRGTPDVRGAGGRTQTPCAQAQTYREQAVSPKRADGPGLIDYALAALLRLGGNAKMVDLEDIAVEAYVLAPDRFRWRRHDFPNLELVRVMLSEAKRGGHLVLQDRKGWMLTVEGAGRAALVLDRINAGAVVHRDDSLRRQDLAEIARMEGHPAYEHWREGGMAAVDAVDLGDLVRCSASTPVKLFVDRLRGSQAVAAYWNRDALARFLGEAADLLPSILAEENQ
ncbi:MAG: hypothetical protein ABSG37_12650 [Candidatus Limnocylindrales bacterium]